MIKYSARGFTLLELLVVIVLLVMAMSIASISILSGRDGAQMKTTARQLLSVLRSSRTHAIAEGREAGIVLGKNTSDRQNTAYDNLTASSRNTDLLEGQAGDGLSYTIIPLNETVTLPEKLTLSVTSSTGTGIAVPESILFYPDGSSSGGRLLLSSSVGQMTIQVSWLTGEVALLNDL